MSPKSEMRILNRHPFIKIGEAQAMLSKRRLKILRKKTEAAELAVHKEYLKEVLQEGLI